MKALITGGAGFIGSHLVEALINRGDVVCVIDDVSTGTVENIAHLQNEPGFCFVNGSVLDAELMKGLIDDHDVIYHLAGAVGVKYIMENRLKAFEVSVRGTEIVLELASRNGKKVMLASTSEIYGKNGAVPYSEDSNRVLGPTTLHRWSYSCTKALSEFLSLAYWQEKGLPVVIMRFFNTVGPRQLGQYGMVVPRFVKQAISGEPLIVHGDGAQTRCFTYIADAVRAMLLLAECDQAVGEAFNVGCDQEISIANLAEQVIKLAESSSTIEYISYSEVYGNGFEDMKRRVPDISKIRRFVGWKPRVGLDDMLTRMIEYARGEMISEQPGPRVEISQ